MNNHLKVSTQIIAGALLGFVLGLQLLNMTNARWAGPAQLAPLDACGGSCEEYGLCCDGIGECTICEPPASSDSSDSTHSSDPCNVVIL